jgi:hypothetical protein
LVLVRLGTLRICAPNNRLTLAFGACWSRMHSTQAWASQDIASHHDRIPRNMRIADSDICSSHDSFGTFRRKGTGAPYARLHGTWNRCGSDARSCCESVQTRRIACSISGSSCILSHAHQNHSDHKPCFRSQLSFPYAFLTAAAVTDPADDLSAVFRHPADGLSASFLRPRCWTPDGRTGRGQATD